MTIIRNLDDIMLVPTPVRIRSWGSEGHVERIEERLQARLFPELKGKPITVVFGSAMGGAPVYETDIKFDMANIQPRAAGGNSPWELSLWWLRYRKRNETGTTQDFPVDPVILLKRHHTLDFAPLLPSLKNEMLVHHDGYGDTWRKVGAYCAEVAGAKAVLIDTTEAAALWHSKWLPEHRADMARRREWERQSS